VVADPNAYIKPNTWGDAVTPPAFILIGQGGVRVECLMPSLLTAFKFELNEGIVKRAKYTGEVHKSIPGTFYDAKLEWILRANDPVRTADGGGLMPLELINYLDVINFIINIDASRDRFPECRMLFAPHGYDERAISAHRPFRGGPGIAGWPFVNFRLSRRTGIFEPLEGKTVVQKVTLEITTDGYVERIPINTSMPPKPIYEIGT